MKAYEVKTNINDIFIINHYIGEERFVFQLLNNFLHLFKSTDASTYDDKERTA